MGDFVKVAEVAGFEAGTIRRAEVGGRTIVIVNVAGRFYVVDSLCTHRGGPLHEGTLEGEVLICPWHGGRFDVRTGEVVRFPPQQAIQTYRVEVQGGDVLVEAPD